MALRIYLLVLSISVLLEACKQKEETKSEIPHIKIPITQPEKTPSDLVVYEAASSIYGEWFNIYADDPKTLILNRDSTFQYINKPHLSDSVKGKWTSDGSDYFLRAIPNIDKSESRESKKSIPTFKIRLHFENGFVYEVNKDGSLSSDYFVQKQNYR